MRIWITALGLVVLTGAALPAQLAAAREKAQQERIGEGARSGELTRREVRRLERQQQEIRQEARRERRDGGGLSAREKVKLERRQNKAGRDIAREKHDAQKRK